MSLGVGIAAGWGSASAALAGGGFVAGAIASGGTMLVAAGAAAATAYAMNKADQAMYGAEDARFKGNAREKMIVP